VAVVVSVTYNKRAPWPIAADGLGYSLVLADPSTRVYAASAQRFGSPGQNGAASMIGGVVISEIHYQSTAAEDEYVELRNITGEPVNLFDPQQSTNC